MLDPAPIRGQWTITPEMRARFDWAWNEWYYGPRQEGRDRAWFAIEAMLEVAKPPLPDEAAIERGANALRRVPRRAVSDEADEGQLREWAEAVLRAALEPGDT